MKPQIANITLRILRGETVIIDCSNEEVAKTTFKKLKGANEWLIQKNQMSEMRLSMPEKM